MPQPRILRSEGIVAARERRIQEEWARKPGSSVRTCRQESRLEARGGLPVVDLTGEEDLRGEQRKKLNMRQRALADLRAAGARYQALLDQFAGKYGDSEEEDKPAPKKPRVIPIPGLVPRTEAGPGRPGLPPVAPQPPSRGPRPASRRSEPTSSSTEELPAGGTGGAGDEDLDAVQVRRAEPVEDQSHSFPDAESETTGEPAPQQPVPDLESPPGLFLRGCVSPKSTQSGQLHLGGSGSPPPHVLHYQRPPTPAGPLQESRDREQANPRGRSPAPGAPPCALRPRVRAPPPEHRGGRGGPPGTGSWATRQRRLRRKRAEMFAAAAEAARRMHPPGAP